MTELRRTIDALRQQSIDAGLTVASLQSTSKDANSASKLKCSSGGSTPTKSPAPSLKSKPCLTSSPASAKPPPHPQQPSNNSSNASCSSLQLCSNRTPERSTDFARRHTFTGNCRDLKVAGEGTADGEMPGYNNLRNAFIHS